MIITYFRSSSYNAHDDCPQRYYMEYNLGWKGPSGLKADRGTIVHKVLEILAIAKKAQQDKKKTFVDDYIGKVTLSKMAPIDTITEQVFGYYTNLVNHHNWSEKDLKICQELVQTAITLNDGMFNPLKRDVVAPELHFDFQINEPWAKYEYQMPDGTQLDGQLAIKGTIDLITKVDDSVYEVVDWKTGKRLNWATGEEKTYEKLQDDPQLRMYHYALSKVYPDIDQIMVTIFFIADGGPFTICYTKDDLPKTEQMLREKFDIIRATQVPQLNRSWKCTKLCPFGKGTFDGTDKKVITEFRNGQVTRYGAPMTMCEQIRFEIQRKGMDKTTKEYLAPGHDVGYYKAPGGVE